jgi:hypothetical protein
MVDSRSVLNLTRFDTRFAYLSTRRVVLRALLIACTLILLDAVKSPAQSPGIPDTLRGTVATENGVPLAGATVSATRAPDRAFATATTDSVGRFAIIFREGTGDYLLHAALPGYKSTRLRIVRSPGGSIAHIRLSLTPSIQRLATVKIETSRPKPERGSSAGFGTGESGRVADGVNGAIAPGLAGRLDAIAGTIPGVVSLAGGASVLGLSPAANGATLSGMAFSGSSIPRDARSSVAVSTSTYEPTRGWFSGMETSVELEQGNLFSQRIAHVTADAPSLQFGSEGASALDQRFRNIQLSVGGDGAAYRDRFLYNFGAQGGRRSSRVFRIGDAPPEVLGSVGLTPLAAAAFIAALRAKGIAPSKFGAAASAQSDNFSFIGRVDHAPYDWNTFEASKKTWALIGFGNIVSSTGLGASAASTLDNTAESKDLGGGIQALLSYYVTEDYLIDVNSTLSATSHSTTSVGSLPLGLIRLHSGFDNGDSTITSAGFGGTGSGSSQSRSLTWETIGRLGFYWTRRPGHRVRITADARFDTFAHADADNSLGTFEFNSLEDFLGGRAATFSRTLYNPRRTGGEWNAYIALSDSWRARPSLRVLYGARAEANRFTYAPPLNNELERALGVRTDEVPNTVDLLPRVGFTWLLNQGSRSRTYSPLGQFNGTSQRYFRGGIGAFRDFIAADLLSNALASTGLSGGGRGIRCVGPAAPIPDWSLVDEPSRIPTRCANGFQDSQGFADSAQHIEIFDHEYTAAKSWRANIAYASNFRSLAYSIEAIYSVGHKVSEIEDLNFSNVARFNGSDGRPIFVPFSAIDPATGLLSSAAARRSDAFGRVVANSSSGKMRSRQLTISATPQFQGSQIYLTGAYTLSSSVRVINGFSGTTFGSPLSRETSRSDLDARHQILVQAGLLYHGFAVTLFTRLQSGLPFTPMVNEDANGDGLRNDRAFIPPVNATPGRFGKCIERQRGNPAAPNSCEGPWTAAMNAQITTQRLLPLIRRRASIALAMTNPLGGIDQLVHGSAHLKGWGSPPIPDRTLYFVRGFDSRSSTFSYDLNPRFGTTDLSRNMARTPFRITLDVTLDIGKPMPVQQLERWLGPGRRGIPGPKLTALELKRRYERNVPDPYAAILAETDSLLLSREQSETITGVQANYRQSMDSIWISLAETLSALPDDFDSRAALKAQENTIDRAWEYTRLSVRSSLGMLLSPLQLALMPVVVRGLYNAEKPIKSRFYMN